MLRLEVTTMAERLTQITKMRECGDCSLCCKLLPIAKRAGQGDFDFPFDKPAGEWCKHCAPGHGGCKIWKDGLPNLCKAYQCLWKVNPNMPESFRPDKIRAIFDADTRLEKFPKEVFFDILLADEVLHPTVEAFINRTDVSFLLRFDGIAASRGRTEEITEAIQKQFNPEGKTL
jgi:hypothetical protein